ncbi:MAG: hypothetical protein Q8Q09_11550 [Deltaproteobacteria bacterium]|nr:hypothetical protein [Deltaproteobacteria bacterium]
MTLRVAKTRGAAANHQPLDGPDALFAPRFEQLAQVLEVVYDMPHELAHEAAQQGVIWRSDDQPIYWDLPDGSRKHYPIDRGCFDAQQAWEAVVANELVGADWLDQPQRKFLIPSLARAILAPSTSPAALSHPHRLRSVVVLAANAPALVTVETLTQTSRALFAQLVEMPIATDKLWISDNPRILTASQFPVGQPQANAILSEAFYTQFRKLMGLGPAPLRVAPSLPALYWSTLEVLRADHDVFVQSSVAQKYASPLSPLLHIAQLGLGVATLSQRQCFFALEP